MYLCVGVFINPTSTEAPAKLRLLYECVAIALIITTAGGSAVDEKGIPILERIVSYYK